MSRRRQEPGSVPLLHRPARHLQRVAEVAPLGAREVGAVFAVRIPQPQGDPDARKRVVRGALKVISWESTRRKARRKILLLPLTS